MAQIRSRQAKRMWYACWADAFVVTIFVSILSLLGGGIGRDIGPAAANPSSFAGHEGGKIQAVGQSDSRMLLASDQSSRHKARLQPPLDDCLLPANFALMPCRPGQVRQHSVSSPRTHGVTLAYRSRAPPYSSI